MQSLGQGVSASHRFRHTTDRFDSVKYSYSSRNNPVRGFWPSSAVTRAFSIARLRDHRCRNPLRAIPPAPDAIIPMPCLMNQHSSKGIDTFVCLKCNFVWCQKTKAGPRNVVLAIRARDGHRELPHREPTGGMAAAPPSINDSSADRPTARSARSLDVYATRRWGRGYDFAAPTRFDKLFTGIA